MLRLVSRPPLPISARPAAKKLTSQHKVRTSQQDRTLDSMFPIVNPSLQGKDTGQKSGPVRVAEIKPSHCNLASVIELRDELSKVKHAGKFVSILLYTIGGLQAVKYRAYGDSAKARLCWNCRPQTLSLASPTCEEVIPSEPRCLMVASEP